MVNSISEQIPLFDSRLPKKPYCSDDLADGLKIRPAATAKKSAFIQVNPPWARTFIVLDVDRPGGAYQWDAANLPVPYWNSVNPENGHAHTCYALDAPVLMGDRDRKAPMRYLAAVEGGLTARIEADIGYGGLITKNPTHRHWRTLTGGWPVDLDYLAEFIDLERHVPDWRKAVPECSIGRNVATFDHIRQYAYRAVRKWWERRNYVHWQNHLHDRAQLFTQGEHRSPIDTKECHHLARSVARWTWNRFSPEGFARWQSNAGKRSAEARRKRNAARDARIVELKESGESYRAIANLVGISRGAVEGVLRTISDRSPTGAPCETVPGK